MLHNFKVKLRAQVLGNLQITATALPDQAGFDELQGVSGNALIANNNAMSAFNFYALKYIGAGITLFQNPSLTTFEAPRLLAIASNSGNDIATGLQVCAAPDQNSAPAVCKPCDYSGSHLRSSEPSTQEGRPP